ncbi:MAG: ribonuclease Z [archaeon]|nr:ribonuclease Z [archaeon]
MTVKITFLGTADAIPSKDRNHTAILLTYEEENILVDCGEGTQRQFRKAELNPCKITRILISHWHGDHVLGIPGLLQTLAFSGYNKTLFIYGPKGTKKYINEMLNTFVFVNKFKIEVKDIEKSGKFFETERFYLEAEKLYHGIPGYAYNFIRKGKFKIDKTKLRKAKLPQNSLLQELKKGKDIVYEGKKYKAKDLVYREDDEKISFVLDTGFDKKIIPFVKNSDLLISEASFSESEKDKAKEHKHLTSSQAGEIAKKSNSKKLFLTHLSQRYERNPEKLLNETKKIFKNSFLAKDLDIIEV